MTIVGGRGIGLNVRQPLAAVFRSFRNRDFRIYSLSALPSLVTDWMTRVAVGWLAWNLTESAAWLGVVGFVELFPSLVLGVLAGAVADRFNRRWLMAFCQSMLVLQSAALAFFVYADTMTIEGLVGLNLFFGIIKALEQPTRHSLVPGLVRTEDISAAIGFDSITFNCARIIGPIAAGAVIVTSGAGPIFVMNTLAFILSTAGLFFVRSSGRSEREPRPTMGFAASIGEGFLYVAKHPGIGPMMIVLTLVSFVARPLESFIPGFAGEVFKTGADGQAILTAAMGTGALAAGIYLTHRPSVAGLTAVFTAMTAGLGIAFIAFISTDIFWIGVPVMVAIGFAVLIDGLGARMLIQTATIAPMRGRVASLYGIILRGMGSIGAILLGLIADAIGLRATFFLAGLLCLGTWLWTLRLRATIAPALETPPDEGR